LFAEMPMAHILCSEEYLTIKIKKRKVAGAESGVLGGRQRSDDLFERDGV
jgi:hypothetical protein